MTLYQEMQDKAPERNPVFTAIETLNTDDEIRQFVKEYEDYIIANTNDTVRGREREVARQNVGYILGYHSDGVMKKWYAALPDVNHPIFGSDFGRGKEITPEEALEAGRRAARRDTR